MITTVNFTDTRRSTMGPYPVLRKRGFIADNGGETTPFVWRGRLLRIEMVWGEGDITEEAAAGNCGVIRDLRTGEALSGPVATGHRFMTAFCEGDTVTVFSTLRNRVYGHVSTDLRSWETFTALTFPEEFELFNTAVCWDGKAYHMAVECGAAAGGENPRIGVPFTIFFAHGPDLRRLALALFDEAFGTERYVACPTLHYADGWYYMIADEALPFYRFVPYIFRTADFRTWEVGAINPVLWYSEEDRRPAEGYAFPPEFLQRIKTEMDANVSDVELCEFEGKTHLLYCTGNQWSCGGVACEAVYDGPAARLLASFF